MAVYVVGVRREFPARHYLTSVEDGPEAEVHEHRYRLEVELIGDSLNEDEYLIDIDVLGSHVDRLVDAYRDELLNDRPEFEGMNPSLEVFAERCCDRLVAGLDSDHLEGIRVRLWEDDVGWASFEAAL
ncbi:MAG: 6-pyruvoyl trahydropterin synthase family protein [Halobacteriota archaeon]